MFSDRSTAHGLRSFMATRNESACFEALRVDFDESALQGPGYSPGRKASPDLAQCALAVPHGLLYRYRGQTTGF